MTDNNSNLKLILDTTTATNDFNANHILWEISKPAAAEGGDDTVIINNTNMNNGQSFEAGQT